jgi:hypothetical protein
MNPKYHAENISKFSSSSLFTASKEEGKREGLQETETRKMKVIVFFVS